MTPRLRVLLPSDVFPPRTGGAGWSAHTLALALIERGHSVTAMVPHRRTNDERRTTNGQHSTAHSPFVADLSTEDVLGVPTIRLDYWAPRIPIIQNYFRYERFWPRFAAALIAAATARAQEPGVRSQESGARSQESGARSQESGVRSQESGVRSQEPGVRSQESGARSQKSGVGSQPPISNSQSPAPSLIIHAQHLQSATAAVIAGQLLGAPVVVTVRDHWPWDYFSTGLHGDRVPYAQQTWAALATDLVARLGPLRGALALPAIPYMLAHVRRRQHALRQADAVIAVSGYVADRLAGIVAPEKLHVIPNMLDFAAIDAAIATPQTSVPPGVRYLLFVGKLERNKGAQLLIDIFRDWRSELSDKPASNLHLVVAGNGPLRPELERELAALGVQVRFLDWIAHDEVLRLMAGCELLLFPSAWGEPLSRVPLEASACGAPILAMPTGGTPDILTDGVNGALEPTAARFARRMAELLARPEQRRELGVRARQVARERFAQDVVVGRVEALYRSLLSSHIVA